MLFTGYPVLPARPIVTLEVEEITNTTDKSWNLSCSVQTLPGEPIDYMIEWLINDLSIMTENHFSRNDTASVTLESRLEQRHFENFTYVEEVGPLNWSPPSAASMRQWTGSALVQVMACRLFGAKPFPEPMLAYCQPDAW